MALQKDITLHNGIHIPNCYVAITTIATTKDNATVEVAYYSGSEMREPLQTEHYVIVVNPNLPLFNQCYNHLKHCDQFKDALDV